MTAAHGDDRLNSLLGGSLLSDRLRGAHDGHAVEREDGQLRQYEGPDVVLGPATQIEIEAGEVRFLVPFRGTWPNEHWLQAFRQARGSWPSHLAEPQVDEGRGLRLGPLAAGELEEHVRALKEQVARANRLYVEEIEPELRRQQEEALRREREAVRLQTEIESKLKQLLG